MDCIDVFIIKLHGYVVIYGIILFLYVYCLNLVLITLIILIITELELNIIVCMHCNHLVIYSIDMSMFKYFIYWNCLCIVIYFIMCMDCYYSKYDCLFVLVIKYLLINNALCFNFLQCIVHYNLQCI